MRQFRFDLNGTIPVPIIAAHAEISEEMEALSRHPSCYLLRSPETIVEQFYATGQACLEQCYHAFSEKDVTAFLGTVVLGGQGTKREGRVAFAERKLKGHSPDVAGFILDNIKQELATL